MVQVLDPGNTGLSLRVGDDLGYTYPFKLQGLKPGGKIHDLILREVMNRARDAQAAMSSRYPTFKTIDQMLTAFVPDSLEFNQNLGNKKEIKVIVPMGYAVMDTLLAHMVSIYTGGVFFQMQGVGPEDKTAAMLAEIVLELQFQKSKMLSNLHTQYRDAYAYGYGVVSPSWKVQYGNRIEWRDTGSYAPVLGASLESGLKQRMLTKGVVWEGNELENWNPYSYLPDPNRPVQDVQKMQFVGFVDKSDYYELLQMEQEDPETFFNVRYLEGPQEYRSEFTEHGEWTETLRDNDSSQTSRRIDVLHMYCRIIPRQWKLGIGEYPELWLFSIAGDRVVIRAQPVTYAHNETPVCVCCPTFDGYSTSPVSIMEIILPMLEALDWFFRSHFHNVRKTLNNMFLIDPYLVNYSQAATSEAGKLICMREHVWGRGVKDAMQQLTTVDVTQNHVRDAAIVMDIIERVSGAVTQLQGVMQTKGERRSATESRDTRLSALGRLSKQAVLNSLHGNKSIGRQCLFNMQQFMQDSVWIQLTGRHQAELRGMYPGQEFIEIRPEMLSGDIDIVLQDPSGEGGEFLNEMTQMYSMIVGNPETMQAFDSVRLMLHLMKLGGTKTPTQFLRDNVRMMFVQDPAQAQELAAQQGLVPLQTQQVPQIGQRGGQGAEAAAAQERSPKVNFNQLVEGAINGG